MLFIKTLGLAQQQQLQKYRAQFKQNREAKYTGVFVNQLETISSNQMTVSSDLSQM